jgi:hypothetical protein
MKRRALTLIACLAVVYSFAQNYEKVNISQNFDYPQQIEVIDFDNDGLEDILVIGLEDFYWYRNQGAAQFDRISLADSIDYFRKFTIFDWENDGDNDLAFTSYDYTSGYSQVSWLENDGTNNFTLHVISNVLAQPYFVRVFDIDQDLDQDFLVSDSNSDELYLFANDGLNNFNTIATLGSNINQFEIADLNGDNDWDIIYGKAYNGISLSSVRCLQNDGLNNFSMITLKSGFNVIPQIKVTDINGDGYFDIVVADSNADKLVWLRNSWSYSFPTTYNIKTNWDGAYRFDVRDINGDNKMDIVAGSTGSDEIYYFQGYGSGSSYSFSAGLEIYDELNQVSGIAIGNFDNQLNMDFAHIDQNEDLVSLWVNNGSQIFIQEKLAYSFNSPRAYDMKDLDGDGDNDFAGVSNDGDLIAWFENKGDDSFQTHTLITNYEEPYVVKIADLDMDGDNDIIAASDSDDRISWWKNDGSGNFTMTHISTNINGPRDLWIEDFDMDGDMDVACVGYASPFSSGNLGAWWFKNDGQQNFTMLSINTSMDGGRSMRGADMNGDTLVDLVISNYYYGDNLYLALNNGNGFNIISIATLKCEDLELVDFDGDNDMDILAIDFDEDSLYFYENTGLNQFSRHTLAHKYRLYGIDPVDYDSDGDIDIIYSTGYSGFTNGSIYEMGIYRNDGMGNVVPEIWDQNLTMIKPIEVYDYEDDGDFDIVVGFDYSHKITMYKNLDINCPLLVDITASGSTDFCLGGSVQLNAMSLDTGISYQWFNGVDSLIGANTDSILVSSSGSFRVSIADSTCASFSNTIVVQAISHDTTYSNYMLCDGDSLEIEGNYYSSVGAFTLNLSDQYACDSVVVLDLSINPLYSFSSQDSICWGETFDFNGTLLSQPGLYEVHYTSEFGCDSSFQVLLSVLDHDTVLLPASICEGQNFLFEGSNLTQAGTYSALFSNQNGCDSLRILELIVHQPDTTTMSQSICEGSSLDFFGNLLWDSGNYFHTLQNEHNCDSVIHLNLQVHLIDSSSLNQSICEGSYFDFYGNQLVTSGSYTHTLLNQYNCDSLIMLNLVVNPIDTTYLSADICEGSGYSFHGNLLVQSGQYIHTLNNQFSCDSVLLLDLSVIDIDSTQIGISLCEGNIYSFFGSDIIASGIYFHTLSSSLGCDSIIELDALYLPVDTTLMNFDICGNDTFDFHGNLLTSSGFYTHLLNNQFSCDSLIQLDLTVNPVYETQLFESFCEYGSFSFFGNLLTQSGIYTEVLTTTLGCDSIITLNLSMNPVDSIYYYESICEGDTFFLAGLPYTSQSLYQITDVNQWGCDSISNLELTVSNNPLVELGQDTSIFNNEILILDAGNGFFQYLWQDGSGLSTYEVDGSLSGLGTFEYSVEVTNLELCSSTDTIFVTVKDYINHIIPDEQFDIKVYPNPVDDKLIIKSDGGKHTLSIGIFDVRGKLIEEAKIQSSETEVDFSQKSEGIYLLKLTGAGISRTIPIVKLKH